ENEGNHAFVEDVDRSSLNQSVLTVLIDHVRLLSNQVTSLINEQANLKDKINKLITSPAPSTEALVAEVVKYVISAIEPELKNIKDHISKIETPSFPSKESLVAEFVKCIETTNSSVLKDVTHLISKQKELSDELHQLRHSSLSNRSTEDINKAVFALIKPELKTFIQSITDSFSKTKVNIHVPKDFMTVSERMKQHSDHISSILNTVSTITQRHVQLSLEFAALPTEIQELRSTMNDIVNFKVEISNLTNKTQENVSTFKDFYVYFSNLQNSVNVFENLVEKSIPTKKEREEDRQLLDVISIIKGKISKIVECMLLLVKWAKCIYVDDSASTTKTIVGYEEEQSKHAEFDRDFTELPLDLESNVIPASTIQEPTSSVLSEDVQSSNKNNEVCDDVTADRTSCGESLSHKPDDTFIYEAGGVEHVMTYEEIAKQKEDEEIIKRKNEENKASHVVVAEIHTTSAQKKGNSILLHNQVTKMMKYEAGGVEHVLTFEEIAKQKEDEEIIKRKNEENKASHAEVIRVIEEEAKINPQCRFFPEEITVVDILSRKGPISVMLFREGFLNMKLHNPFNLCDFNYDKWMEIRKCMVTKTSKQAKIILDNIEYKVKELSEIKKSLGLVSDVPLSELDPMIEYHGILNKRKYKDSHVMSAEKEYIRLVEAAIENKNDEYPDHKRIKLERMDMM
ncbi:hypothetical protein Tco_0514928, partial [Tanacetum coccineum]